MSYGPPGYPPGNPAHPGPWNHPPGYPPGAYPPPPGPYPPPPEYGAVPPYPYYPTMMVPVPIMAPPYGPPAQPAPTQPEAPPATYITNYIYHGETPATENNQLTVVESSGEFDWVHSTAMAAAATLTGRAVVGGHEGWDGSPLWIIRTWHQGDLIPGKLSVRHNAASVTFNGKEIGVQNLEVLCAKPETLRWIPSTNGAVPPGAIPGGRTATGETLYVGRARHQLSITPGKIHPSHSSCYIGFAGTEAAHKMYDVLCRVS